MKMRNTVPRAGLEPTSLTFRASVIVLHHIGSPMSLLYPCPPICVQLLASEVSADYYNSIYGGGIFVCVFINFVTAPKNT